MDAQMPVALEGQTMMGLSCASLSCDGFGDENFVPSLDLLPDIGYEYIELNCWNPADLTPTTTTNLRRRCDEADLTPVAVYGASFGGTGFDRSKDVSHKIRMIDAAVELGCHRVVATGAPRGEQGGLDGVIDVLNEVVPYAEKQGVLVCLENHANNNIETIEDYETILSAVDSNNVGVCVDTGHFEAAGIELEDVVDRLHCDIVHIHVKETSVFGEEDFIRFGEGDTDNERFLELMLDHGYYGYVTVELALKDKSNVRRDLREPIEMFDQYF